VEIELAGEKALMLALQGVQEPRLNTFLRSVPICEDGLSKSLFASPVVAGSLSPTTFLVDKPSVANFFPEFAQRIKKDKRAWMLTSGHFRLRDSIKDEWRVIFDFDSTLLRKSHRCASTNQQAYDQYLKKLMQLDTEDDSEDDDTPKFFVSRGSIFEIDTVLRSSTSTAKDVSVFALKNAPSRRPGLPLWSDQRLRTNPAGQAEALQSLVGRAVSLMGAPFGTLAYRSYGGYVQNADSVLTYNLLALPAMSGGPVMLDDGAQQGQVVGLQTWSTFPLCLEVTREGQSSCYLIGLEQSPEYLTTLAKELEAIAPKFPDPPESGICWKVRRPLDTINRIHVSAPTHSVPSAVANSSSPLSWSIATTTVSIYEILSHYLAPLGQSK